MSSSISVFGIPNEIISDNNHHFVIREYNDFAARYGFKLNTSSQHYPRGHGFIERQLQTIKNVLNRCAEDGTDAKLALMQLRDTPLDSRTPSPGELLQNRQLKTTVPSIIRPATNNEAGMMHMLRSSHSSCPPACKATGPRPRMVYHTRGPIQS